MGCVSSNLFNHDGDDFSQLGSSALGHHIVSLTSSTYGLLTLDPPPPATPTTPLNPPSRFTLGSIFPSSMSEPRSLWSDPKPLRSDPEVINSWELMAGLDAESFRFPTPNKPFLIRNPKSTGDNNNKENSNPNQAMTRPVFIQGGPLDRFEPKCPPGGENRLVLYTTSLRGVRKTFEACNAVRSAIENLGAMVCERDVSMDLRFREELKDLVGKEAAVPPRLFVKGRYVGGVDEVMRIVEEGLLGELLEGLPKKRAGSVCEGCGEAKFLPCFQCNGSSKMVLVVKEEMGERSSTVVVRCPECNENGLVLCPICS